MSTVQNVEATVTPSGETQILSRDKEHPQLYIYVGGGVYDVKSVVLKPSLVGHARPARILFGAINHPLLRVKRAIALDISVEEKSVVASSPELEEFGYGSTLSEALDDFGKTVCELYLSLEGQEDKLSVDLKQVRSKLGGYLEPRRAAK